jgi:AcrR family transcriptional regulator
MDRLPRGRHGLSPEFVARNQRERLIAALIFTLADVGYQKTTVSMIGRRAAVSKSDFYKHFDSKDDCFLAAYDFAVERMRVAVTDACAAAGLTEWSRRVQIGVIALLGLLAEEPALAAVVLAEGLRAGRGIYDRYQGAVESFVPLLRDGAPDGPDGGAVPRATDEAAVGGVASLLSRRVIAGETADLTELAPDVIEFVLTPHLGTEAARRIISAG